jgi:hypothetical protein
VLPNSLIFPPFYLRQLPLTLLQRLGKCYFVLSMMRDAEEAFNNSLKLQVAPP